ncbi:hypothetical protein [Paenibacillus sp. BAC0078]
MSGIGFVTEARFAKSFLENEEGINHLWIRIGPINDVEHASVRLQLPQGVYWDGNAGNCFTDAEGQIVLDQPQYSNELLLEIYTVQPIGCGETELDIIVSCRMKSGEDRESVRIVPLRIVDADSAEAEQAIIDEEVVSKVKEQRHRFKAQHPADHGDSGMLDCTPGKLIRYDPCYRSELEKQYRVEGTGN